MSLDPGLDGRSASPESSGRDSPLPRQWRNQLGDDTARAKKDKQFRKYAAGVERALALFETALEEWADYISFLNRLLKALQARSPSITTIPSRVTVAKRLSQCLNPSLPSGVHQKALEVYNYVFSVIGQEGLSIDLPLYLPGLASTLSFASLSVRGPYLDILENHFVGLNRKSLRPALKAIVLALLPGLEEETSEDFDRTLKLVDKFKVAVRPLNSKDLSTNHSSGDDFFWQCFFLASITGQSRRLGALAYLTRYLPRLGGELQQESPYGSSSKDDTDTTELSARLCGIVTSPEPGLLLRCFAAGLGDEQLLIQRGYLDLLVTHLPLHSKVLQAEVKAEDLGLLIRSAIGVVTRRDMSLNRRLWAWFLGPDPGHAEPDHPDLPSSPSENPTYLSTKTGYFEEHGLQPLVQALLGMIRTDRKQNPAERARPYRICLSLMDRWEIGGLVVPEVFLPVIDSVRRYKSEVQASDNFNEVVRSASVFFDGVESGLIYGEIVGLLAQAIGPGNLSDAQRRDKLDLVNFILSNFNVREEEMVTIHAPLTALAILCMLGNAMSRLHSPGNSESHVAAIIGEALKVTSMILELVPARAFPAGPPTSQPSRDTTSASLDESDDIVILKKIRTFYVNEQGNIDSATPPFAPLVVGELVLQRASNLVCQALDSSEGVSDLAVRIMIFVQLILKLPSGYHFDTGVLVVSLRSALRSTQPLKFPALSSMVTLASRLLETDRIALHELSEFVAPLVKQTWFYLSATDPKYHVETVRLLWQLQTALSPNNRDIEAAISSLMISHDTTGTLAARPSDPGRRFAVLWSHSLLDNPSERRGSKTPLVDSMKFNSSHRIAGVDYYEVMLTQPLFLMLDALLEEKTQLFMTVKSWLNTMVGIDKMFLIIASKFTSLPFLQRAGDSRLSEDDDLDTCLYYLRTLSNVFRWAPDIFWKVLASTSISTEDLPSISPILGDNEDISLQELFLQVCMRCLPGGSLSGDTDSTVRASRLSRAALTVLHQIALNPFAGPLSALSIEHVLLERLAQSLDGSDPYVQILLLDVVYAAFRLHDLPSPPLPASPSALRRVTSADSNKAFTLTSLDTTDANRRPPPPALLKCLLAGLSSTSSRPVLDSWVSFLTECLSLYSDSIFQILIPLVETLCAQVGSNFNNLQTLFSKGLSEDLSSSPTGPESTLISLLNGLEEVLARAHAKLLEEESKVQALKSPDQPQGFFGNMVSGVFSSDAPHSRSATANDRLTVNLAFQDAVRICYTIWSWGQGEDAQSLDSSSASSFNYTSLRMRNRARRLLEHLFAAEPLECLETFIDIWRSKSKDDSRGSEIFNLFPALDGSRPKNTIPAIFNAIYSRASPSSIDDTRKSTMTISLHDADLVIFLVDYTRSLEDDTMDEIWQDCMAFLRDLLANPFPHRQTLPSLIEFAAILGEKVDNTNFGEQRKMRRELGDIFLKLLTALFTTRPMTFSDLSSSAKESEKADGDMAGSPVARAENVVGILASIVPNLSKILVEPDRVLSAASAISTNVIGPALRSKSFPDTLTKSTVELLFELTRLANNQKTWKKDVADAFNDPRFFGSPVSLVKENWMPILKQWAVADKDRVSEIIGRISPPTTAGIVFGVGATSARLEADRKTQLNLRRIATLILASTDDAFVSELAMITGKLAELLGATATSSPSSTTRAEVYMVIRALVLKTSAIHLAILWPVINSELHSAISSVVAPDHSPASETYNNASVLQACKLLDLLICAMPDDFQLHEWLFVTDTIDAVYRPSTYQPVALVDEISEELGSVTLHSAMQHESATLLAATREQRRPLLGPGGISDDVSFERRDELIARVLRPFFGQLSIFAFESTYAMGSLDHEVCRQVLLKDLFDERSIVKAL